LVDIETGILSAAKSNPGFYPCDRHPRHCDSGAAIEGVSVPYWEQAMDLCVKVATAIPGMVHVGWDVAITADGPVIVEGNARLANPNLIQAHRPLLTNPRIRRFYEFHGVLP
jgi:short-subunit dehydrogenase involved in D-alanine esterification of teichoic acids